MTPEQIAKADTEHAHQAALFCWVAANLDKHHALKLFHAIPNGGLRTKAQAGKLKAEGVRPGVPDTFLPFASRGFHGLYIELKKPSMRPTRGGKGGVSDEQSKFMQYVWENGYCVIVCYSWDEAAKYLCGYLEVESGLH